MVIYCSSAADISYSTTPEIRKMQEEHKECICVVQRIYLETQRFEDLHRAKATEFTFNSYNSTTSAPLNLNLQPKLYTSNHREGILY